jgi:hypothetical protein
MSPKGLIGLFQSLVENSDFLLIIFPLMCLLRLANNILVLSLKLIQVILGQITMLLDSPFQAPSPLPIPVVYHRIKDLIPLGICQMGGDERPWIL